MQKLDKGDPPLMDLFNDCFFYPSLLLSFASCRYGWDNNCSAQVGQLVRLLLVMMNKHNAVFEVVLVHLHLHLRTPHQLPPPSLMPLVVSLPWDRVPFLVEEDPKPVMVALLRILCSCRVEGLKGVIDHLVSLLEKQVVVIKAVALVVLEDMLGALTDPNLQDQLENIFFALLFGSQTSSRVFEQILPFLGRAINELLMLIDDGSARIAEKLAEAAVFHYFRFPGLAFPGELKEVLHAFSVRISTERWVGQSLPQRCQSQFMNFSGGVS